MKGKKKDFSLLKKKKFMIFVMVLLIGVTGYVNYSHNKGETAKVLGEAQYVSTNTEVEVSKTQTLKMEREEARDKAKSALEEIIKNEGYSNEAKQEAEKKLIALAEYIRIEGDVETLIKDKGFEEVVVTYNENGIVADIFKDELLNTEIAKITEIIVSQTNLSTDKIKITTNN